MKRFVTVMIVLLLGLLLIYASNDKNKLVNVKDSFLLKENSTSKPLNIRREAKNGDMLQVRSGGHILRFKPAEMYIAAATHMLKVEFSGAKVVNPVSESLVENGNTGKAGPLSRVTYNNLWENVTLVYDKAGTGVYKSTYYIEPAEDGIDSVNNIKLKYNVPVKVEKGGNLLFTFKTGQLRESKPIAWQEIDGKRVPVKVSYKQLGDKEIGFSVENYNLDYRLIIDPTLTWHTFMGSANFDEGYGITVDSSGNVYVTGYSSATWGTPLNAHAGSGNSDIFVAKLNNSGTLQWNTFMGSASFDDGSGITVDSSGNVYVTGYSSATWGTPLNAHAGGDDAFVAKLNSEGTLQWHTFMGSASFDDGSGITVDSSGNVYVTGYSYATWGTPLNAYAGSCDAFVAKLNSSGTLQWHTFMGSASFDDGSGITVDSSSNIYVTGWSEATWGTPLNAYAGGDDAFVAKLNSSGTLQWNTFMGSADPDYGSGITVDSSSNVYVTGFSYATWGTPLNAYAGGDDAFVAKLNSSGTLQWNTFLGSLDYDWGRGITVDSSSNVYVTGGSSATWGTPLNAYAGWDDAFVAKLNSDGTLQWHTFLGSADPDYGSGITVDSSSNVYVTGWSEATWGTPLNAYAGGDDAFVAKIEPISIISGTVTSGGSPLEDVVMNGLSGNPTTNSSGDYSGTVDDNWSGTVTPTLFGYTFVPSSRIYTNVTSSQTGQDYTATIIPIPIVTTTAVSGITASTVSSGGNVIYGGSSSVTTRGVCWSTSINPTIADSHTTDGTGTGVFTSSITGLNPNTTYHVRAYARNSSGTSYGRNETFTTLKVLPTIVITNPTNGATVDGTVAITADSSIIADPVEFYIDDVLLGNGVLSSVSDNSKTNSIYATFNIDNSEYLFIDGNNQLKKISKNWDIKNVFDTDIKVEDISLNSFGEVFIELTGGIILKGNNLYKSIKIDIINKTVLGINKQDHMELSAEDHLKDGILQSLRDKFNFNHRIKRVFDVDKDEFVMIGYKETTGNYSIISTSKFGSDDNFKILAFLKKKPVKVIKNTILAPYNVPSATVFNFTLPEANDEFFEKLSKRTYTIDWNTLDHSDGIHKIKVLAQDEYNRSFFDEIEVLVRNFKIDLSAIRKEDRALTFKILVGELTFSIENPKNLPVTKYVIYRSVSGGEFEPIEEIESSAIVDNKYTFYDKNISTDSSYTYKVVAYDSSENLLSISEEKTI